MAELLQCISPIDGSVYAQRPLLDFKTAIEKIDRARLAQADWAQRKLSERVELVKAAVALIGKQNNEIVPELAWQMGRPVRYGGEFRGFEERAFYMADIAEQALSPLEIEDSNNFKRFIAREPHGLVLVIAPWNYPYMTAINTVAPALIAGNAVLLKHASQTLLVGERMEQAFIKAGVPKDIFQNLFLDHETVGQLIGKRAFNFINFTGSVAGGQAIERAAAGTFTGIGLELGGKDAGFVMEDAHLEAAVETLIDGAMFNSGQCCCGIERIYVHKNLYDDFVDRAIKVVANYQLGNPLDEATTIGPMAHKRFAKEVRAQIEEAVKSGAKIHIEKMANDDNGTYLTPQILTNVNHSMRIMRQETFGPTVGIMKVDDELQALKLINDSDYGLTVSLWTKDVERAQKLGSAIETGTIFLNRADYLDPALCWTGCKDTGRGGGLSVIGYHNLTRPKSYHLRKHVS